MRGKRVVPRVSAAEGGLMPGFDVRAHLTAQEMDDLEYVERMKRFK
jgi:hypothetical protein